MQTADCRPDTKCRLGTKCRLRSGYKMQTRNLQSFFVWYVITCYLTTYLASRNRFSAISFHDHLNYWGIFLVHFLMTIDRNIISRLHKPFSLCARVGWCDVCTDFTKVIKVDVDVNEIKHVCVRVIIFLSGMCLFCWQNCRPRPKLFLRLDIFSTSVDHIILTYLRKSHSR